MEVTVKSPAEEAKRFVDVAEVEVTEVKRAFVDDTVVAKIFVEVTPPTSRPSHRKEDEPSLYVRSPEGEMSEETLAFKEMRSEEVSPKEMFPMTERLPVVVTFPCLEIVKTSPDGVDPRIR